MTSAARAETSRGPATGDGVPRLLAGIHGERPISLSEHLALHGPVGLPSRRQGARLVDLVSASGLSGRGGSSFPTAAKLQAVMAEERRPVVVVNGTEGEPVSGKDKVLLRHAPHLVLDGAVVAAAALGAREAIVAVSDEARNEQTVLAKAISERARSSIDGRIRLELAVIPRGFVSGEETALVQFLSGGPAKPTTKPPLPFERGVRGAPTLIQNAETLAHLALIARFGPDWFRELGTPDEPGSVLVTISGAVRRPGVHEAAFGTPLTEIVTRAGGLTEAPAAFLIGGYFGSWISARDAERLRLSNADLKCAQASLGAGAIVALGASACGVGETARVTRYLAAESAGQCGPCVFGLAAIADALERAARFGRDDERLSITRWLGQVKGRGACRHPDGAARFVGSALAVFADEFEDHLRRRRCGREGRRVLPAPERRRS